MTEQILKKDSNEYKNLEKVANILTALNENITYRVEECYFDFGQDWMWTTIIAYDLSRECSYQAIYSREWDEIISCTSNDEILDFCKNFLNK